MFFIYITSEEEIPSNELIDKIENISKELNKPIEIRRLDKSSSETHITLNVRINDIQEIHELTQSINKDFSGSDISIVDGQRLMPK